MGIINRRMTLGEERAKILRDRDLDQRTRNDPDSLYYQALKVVGDARKRVDQIEFERSLQEELFDDYPE